MDADMRADAVDATEDAAQEAWNRVKPWSGIPAALCFVACWTVIVVTLLVVPATHELATHPKEHTPVMLGFMALAFVISKVVARLQVLWHRVHMPDGLVGADTAAFVAQGYEIVGGNDYYDDDHDERMPRTVRTILFRPAAGDRKISVFAYPAGSDETRLRGRARRITLLISGSRVRVDDASAGDWFAGGSSGADASRGGSSAAHPKPKYKENGQYLLVLDKSAPSGQAGF
ncbi:hypothetical protein JS533_006355 [Bifidobacterium amazonense]|uniref:SMODS-associating 2TM beta-strand rich effector domain-containing protein n=1 Tax=Bifidobacterium amazonense TaxID=2809027 RepID=A0ABS9VUW1_9BIFI|nr:hypothetical protein [Bifidobacterium amazonense]MCH9275894.1 hypothetical protein [Bifidobacterium amazonense]